MTYARICVAALGVLLSWGQAIAAPPGKNDPNIKRFLELWGDLHNEKNGYFSAEGIPYHSVETLIVEAPDHGHETTSEAMSYWLLLEAQYGKVTGEWDKLN